MATNRNLKSPRKIKINIKLQFLESLKFAQNTKNVLAPTKNAKTKPNKHKNEKNCSYLSFLPAKFSLCRGKKETPTKALAIKHLFFFFCRFAK